MKIQLKAMTGGKTDNLEAGHLLGRYRVVSKIGAGGMGEVYLAEDTRLRRRVAVKILTEEVAADAKRLLRFEQEAHAASALNHPNILTIYEFGDDDGFHFLVSEFVEGKTLREMLDAGKIDLAETLRITIQIASALQAAHAAGIVHRDIKPENVMIRNDGYVKVLDFGLAKLAEIASAKSLSSYPEELIRTLLQTQPGTVMGTAAYMSPEQARGKEVDFRTDIFSLGVVLYELLTRRLPFAGETVNHLIVSILDQEPPPISGAFFWIPAELENITLRALAKNREHRYQATAELIGDLRALRKRLEFEAELERTSPPNKTADTVTQTFKTETTEQFETGNTIAVLPFVNMSRNEDGDYFSDGLAEELINVLSKIRGLRVAARTSAFSFKGKQTTIAEIGRVLNVASILEGSIRISGERVRTSTQLIKVSDGYHLWSETYDRNMDDIFAVQDDIAQSVVEELRTMLLGRELGAISSENISSEVAAAVKGRAADPEAQRLMLLGRYFLDRTTREDTSKAIVYFRQALDLDATYALGWAELGRAYSIEAGRGWILVAQGFDSSREATLRALSLEPNLAEAHAQLGRIQIAHDWDFRGAQASYRKAVELAPGSSSVLDGAALLAYKLGQFDESLKLSRHLLVQNPLNAAFWHNHGLTCHAANMLAESEKAFRKALELVSQRFVTRALLALVLMDDGRDEEALAVALREPDEFWRCWSLAILHYAAGRKAGSDEMIQKLSEKTDGNAYQIAEIYSMRNEIEMAFEWLERAYRERDSGITHTKVNPRFRPLHGDSRWAIILKKIGFEP
ncbi:MAG: protein kinase domain-containing protein [Pyrinomonadaceae bacterium]